jgi:hypothetical protein
LGRGCRAILLAEQQQPKAAAGKEMRQGLTHVKNFQVDGVDMIGL